MQKLYSFSYPCNEVAKVDNLYIHSGNCIIDSIRKEIHLKKGGYFHTCTYYNAFSLEKWTKYTDLSSLFLCLKMKGQFQLKVYTKYLTAGDYLDRLLYDGSYSLENYENLQIDLTTFLDQPGLLYFEITATNDNCVFLTASYECQESFVQKTIGAVICTYKRESYIAKFCKNFGDCTSREHLHVFISDNGQTLAPIADSRVHLFKNKNYGGAGGFTRGMLEIRTFNKNAFDNDKIDYVLLMDDDIVIDFNLFEKLISFISLKKQCYSNYFLAGGMASLDYPFLQYERYSSWRGSSFVQFGSGYDLRDINTIVTNEREEHFNNCSSGWWFSCFSVKMISHNNYPFPCFFRGDDMEFTIRNGSHIITLNGINVWHEPFYKKYSITSENYYLFRNTLVINSLYLTDLEPDVYIKYLLKRFITSIIKYDYRSAELLIMAWKDYCKGVKFFMKTDPEVLNTKLSQYNYKLEPIKNMLEEYSFDDINGEIYNKSDRNKLSSLIRHLTLNGYLIPTCFYKGFGTALVGFGARNVNFYRTKRVYNFDPFTRKGYFTEINKVLAIRLTIRFFKQARYFKRNFKKIQNNYQSNFWRVQTEEFWRKYLDI